MSHLLWYTIRMMIKETLFEVLTFDGEATLGFIKAYDADHAKRISERLYCEGVLIKKVNRQDSQCLTLYGSI